MDNSLISTILTKIKKINQLILLKVLLKNITILLTLWLKVKSPISITKYKRLNCNHQMNSMHINNKYNKCKHYYKSRILISKNNSLISMNRKRP